MSDEQLVRLAHSRAYGLFGFGSNAIEFAKRLINLRSENPEGYRLLWDIADRVAFIDGVRFEVGWKASDIGSHYDSDFSDNLDALEIHLLCTCIDALAGGASYIPFPDWLEANLDKVTDAIVDKNATSAQEYLEVTRSLFESYQQNSGLSRTFVAFFMNLPDFLKALIADSLVFVKGTLLSKQYNKNLERWKNLTVDEKIRKIARDYLYDLRRSEYAHAGKRHEVANRGTFRRSEEAGSRTLDDGKEWWSITSFWDERDASKAKYTLLVPKSIDEGFLLRAVIAIWIRTNRLKYPADGAYVNGFLKQNKAVATIYAFLNEMEQNRERLDSLLTINPERAMFDNNLYYFPIAKLSTDAGEYLVREFGDFVASLDIYIRNYLLRLQELNERIEQLNIIHPPHRGDSQTREQAIVDFSSELSMSHIPGDLRSHHMMIFPNLKRYVETGQIHYRSASTSPD